MGLLGSWVYSAFYDMPFALKQLLPISEARSRERLRDFGETKRSQSMCAVGRH